MEAEAGRGDHQPDMQEARSDHSLRAFYVLPGVLLLDEYERERAAYDDNEQQWQENAEK